MKKEVVITGLGVAAPNAIGGAGFLTSLQRGVSGIAEIRSFDTSDYEVHRGGEVKGVRADGLNCELPTYFGRTALLALVACDEAWRDAGLSAGHYHPSRAGLILGTTSGEVQAIETVDEAWALKRQEQLPREIYTSFSSNFIASVISSTLGFAGPALMLTNACASGNFAIGYGRELILQGAADVIVAGGADSFSKVALAGFSKMHAVAPEKCQPFDRERKGMMVSEGAGIVVLEERQRAEERKAKIYAVILGAGLGCDAFHLTAPAPEGMATAMRRALRDAGVAPSDIDYISAHGTGTPVNDAVETEAMKMVFGDHAYRVPVSSIKSMIGHTMGAASAIETVACCLTLEHGFLSPTINYEQPDPKCDLDYVPNQTRFQPVNLVMNNSFAFGGNNSSLILSRS